MEMRVGPDFGLRIRVDDEGALSRTGAGRVGLGGNAYIDLYWEDL